MKRTLNQYNSPCLPSRTKSAILSGLAFFALGSGSGFAQISVEPIPVCQDVPNGDFRNGFNLWTQQPCIGGFGDHNGTAFVTIDDLTSIGCDQNVACLYVDTEATWTCDKPSGSASQSQMSISTTTELTAPFLKFKVVGGFEFFQCAMSDVKWNALVTVTDEDGNVAKCPILEGDWEGFSDCDVWLQALGAIPLETVCCNVAKNGIQVGDTVTIEVIWSASVIACNECDTGLFFGTFCVDEFEFCNVCLMTPFPIEVQPVVHPSPRAPAVVPSAIDPAGLIKDVANIVGAPLFPNPDSDG